MTGSLADVWRTAQLAEVSSVHPVFGPDATVVVPLLLEGRPALALPYAQLDLARRLADAEVVLWSVAVPGLAGGRRPVAAAARVEVQEDPDGVRFTTSPLLEQLLAKHPPSRARLDSDRRRREHAWYVPRLLVRTVELGPSFELGYLEAVGVTATADGDPWVAPASQLALAQGTARLEVPDGPAAVLQHGADVPELETPWRHRWHGTVRDGRFTAETRDDVPMARRRPSSPQRQRAERDLRRACEQGLRDAGL
ncbi:hypothetical protein FTX61_00190 [Nitriliruptoraceae bacterium ZYF776]|nr:hypothetical protein [Profundirhabdus halotolerans]